MLFESSEEEFDGVDEQMLAQMSARRGGTAATGAGRRNNNDENKAEEETTAHKRTGRYAKERRQKLLEANSIKNELSKSDRRIIKAFLGYLDTVELKAERNSLKKRSDACLFVSQMLWIKPEHHRRQQASLSTTEKVTVDQSSVFEREEEEEEEEEGDDKQIKESTVEEGRGGAGGGEGGRGGERKEAKENEDDDEEDDVPFDLRNEIVSGIGNIPSIFFNPNKDSTSEHENLDKIKQLFLEGRTYQAHQETALVRSFTTFPRLWDLDISSHDNYSRVLICGPVSISTKQQTYRD